jgi:predicted DNA-binding transcriptional regulator AlpA
MTRNLLTAKEVATRLRRTTWTIWRWEKIDPEFPKRIVLSPGSIAFFEDEITAYINSRARGGTLRWRAAKAAAVPQKRRVRLYD